MPSNVIRSVRSRNLFAWWVSFCFVNLAMTAAAQSQTPGQSPDTNGSVAVPPYTQPRPIAQPAIQPPPSQDLWDRWGIQKVSENDDWTRHFRIGAMVGMNISANFSAKGPFINPNPQNGIFSDGYVRSDGKGDRTGFWGYNTGNNNATPGNPSQYDAVNQTMSMHAISAYSPVSGGNAKEDGSAFPGFDLAYGGNLWDWGQARIGWEFGFGLLPISITSRQTMTATVTNSTYMFDTTGVIIDDAPYYGTFGGEGGSTLPLKPFLTTSVPGGTETITGSYELDAVLFTFRLGPSVYWDLNEDLGLSAGAGPALGLVTGRLKFNETVGASTPPIHGEVDGTDVVYGGYVNATLLYHVQENGDLYLGVQYMSLGDASISGGGREGRLNLGGQVYIMAGINWPF